MAGEDLNDAGQNGPEPTPGLDRLEAEARALEAEADAEAKGPDAAPEISQAQIWAQVPLQVGALLAMALPELAGVYTEPRCLAWGNGMAAVAEKYGWDAGESIGKWAPEIMLIAASIPLIVPTVQAFKKKRAEAERVEGGAKPQTFIENGDEGPNNAPQGPSGGGLPTPGGFVEPS